MASAEHTLVQFFHNLLLLSAKTFGRAGSLAPRKVIPKIQEGKGPHKDDQTCRHCEVRFHSVLSRQGHERRKVLGEGCRINESRLYSKRKGNGVIGK